MKITLVPIAEIKPFEKNAKLHPAEQIERIAKSITQYGFNQPIVVDKDNVIIVGHGRHAAALKLGIAEVPVVKLDISPEKARQYRLVDNKTNESDWDIKLLITELAEIKGLDFEPKDFGFDLDLQPMTERLVDVATTDEDFETFKNGAIKQIVLIYSAEQFDEIIVKLSEARADLDVPDNSELLVKLLEFYANFGDRPKAVRP